MGVANTKPRALNNSLKLLLCLLIDFIGVLTVSIPIVGEFFDIFWAPLSAYLLLLLFGNWGFCVLGFVEEMLPYTDIIPTATLGWFIERMYQK